MVKSNSYYYKRKLFIFENWNFLSREFKKEMCLDSGSLNSIENELIK